MSDGHLPVRFDPFRLAERGEHVVGTVALGTMERLAAFPAETHGNAEVELSFATDRDGQAFVQGHVRCELRLTCQRCLEPMRLPIDSEFRLGFVSDEVQAERLSSEYEPYEVGDEPVFLKDLIEDELILSLPVIPRHDPGSCAAAMPEQTDGDRNEESGAQEKVNPFAVLAKLKDPT